MENDIKIVFEGKTYTLTSQAKIEYRSHRNGLQCNEPDNWLSAMATDETGNIFKVWWFADDINAEDGEYMMNDWDDIHDIEKIS